MADAKERAGIPNRGPNELPRLSSVISDFLNRANYPLILLEGMGISLLKAIMRPYSGSFSPEDEIALKNAIMLVHIDPLSLDIKELHRLASEMEEFKV